MAKNTPKTAKKRAKPLSMYPLKTEEALKMFLSVAESKPSYGTKPQPLKKSTRKK